MPWTDAQHDEDPHLWLEEVTGDAPLTWVRERNAETAKQLETGPAFGTLEAELLEIMDSDAKIPVRHQVRSLLLQLLA